jgi:hypothetical protein
MSRSDRVLRLVILIMGTCGLVLLGAGLFFFGQTRGMLGRSLRAEGVVVRVEQDRAFVPVVEFTTEAGERVEFWNPVGSSTPTYAPGDQVPVLYDPQRPEHAQITSFLSLWLAPLVLGSIGAVMLFLSLLFMVFLRSTIGPGSARVDMLLQQMQQQQRAESVHLQPDDWTLQQIKQHLQGNQKIQAIKLYRQSTGVGLKEAKDQVDELERRMRRGEW